MLALLLIILIDPNDAESDDIVLEEDDDIELLRGLMGKRGPKSMSGFMID